MLAALRERGVDRPYRHQAICLDAIDRGRDVVLATPTASGKSLCFQAPLVSATLADPSCRALMLFPTKALARDQVEGLRGLVSAIPDGAPAVGVAVYDGDTPPDARRAARSRAHAIATNPDMLHRSILPHHERWGRFLAGLRFVVLDELHVYRGLFGSHVANVLRRLWRLCAHYQGGSSSSAQPRPQPQIIACSATIANPGELAQALCSRAQPFDVIDSDDAPKAERTFLVLNPKVVDPLTGIRRDYLKVTRQVTTELRRAGVQTLAFCRTRKAVELLTRYLREDERRESVPGHEHERDADRDAGVDSAVRGYRGGYLPQRRREVERAMREGEARVVAATNALELGLDIGGVDAVVLSGYPGTRAATIQRAGRAGRRGRPSLAVMCLSSAPLDQFIAADPQFLWGRPPEHARVDPDNPEVVLPHLRCAAHELPMMAGDTLAGLAPGDVSAALDYLGQRGALHRDVGADGEARYLAIGDQAPADQVDLRGTIEENFTVVDVRSGDILAEVAFEDGPLYVHPGAIYTIEGRTHEVLELDWDARKAMVRKTHAAYYTEAIPKTRVRVIDGAESPQAVEPKREAGRGYAHVVRTVPGFKKIRFGTHENVGFGPIDLPDLELHTSAAYWPFPRDVAARLSDPVRRASAALGAAHALHHVAAMVLMCDRGDLGHVVTAGHPSGWGAVLDMGRRRSVDSELAAAAAPYLVLYDSVAGGAGLASAAHDLGEALMERAARIVRACQCARGCPTCMGPSTDDDTPADRNDVAAVLEGIAKELCR